MNREQAKLLIEIHYGDGLDPEMANEYVNELMEGGMPIGIYHCIECYTLREYYELGR
jgi:hypothetical protein